MVTQRWLITPHLGLLAMLMLASTTHGQLVGNIIDINFDGGTAANAGIGPDGIALGDPGEATFSGGAFSITDIGGVDPQPGLSVPFDTASPSPFGGSLSWNLSFDLTSNGGFGPLFQANGDPTDFGDGIGAVSLVMDAAGQLTVDSWLIGGASTAGLELDPLNNGDTNTINLGFDSAAGELSLSVNSSDSVVIGGPTFARPASPMESVTFGGLVQVPDLLFDFGASNQICDCTFDNIVAQTFPPPPEAALTVQLDAATGAVSIVGTATTDAISGFTVTSSSGNLDPMQYTGIAGVLDATGNSTFDGNDTYQVDTTDAFTAAESDIAADGVDDGTLVADGAVFQIGGPGFWQPLPFVNLEVTATLAAGGETMPGGVTILNAAMLPVAGDIAGDIAGPGNTPDGDVDIFDYLQLLEVFDDPIGELSAFESYLLGDLDGNGFKNLEDLIVFRNSFDAANGAGSFQAALASLSVPEPVSLVGVAMVGVLIAGVQRRRGAAFALVVALGLGCVGHASAQTTLFNYDFATDFSNSEGPTGAATVNAEAFTGLPTASGGQANFSGSTFSWLDVPLANPASVFTSDFTLSLDFSSTGNSAGGASNSPTGVVLFAAANTANAEESFSVYVTPGGDLQVDFIGSDAFAGCFGCGLLDGSTHSVEVSYAAPVEGPGQLALRVNGSVVALNPEAFAGLDAGSTFQTSIGGHAQRELINGDNAFPTGGEEGGVFTALEMQGIIDNVKLTDAANIPSVLTLEIDQTTGVARLIGGGFARDIVTIEIGGAENAFVVENWNSLSDQNLDPSGTGDGETWDEFVATSSQLVEFRAIGSSLLDETDDISLGAIYNTETQADFLEVFVGAINPVTGAIENVGVAVNFVNPPPVPGDANDDGLVDVADYEVWRMNFGATSATLSMGDFNGDAVVNAADYTVWRDNFAPPEEEFGAAAIPEPTTFALLTLLTACAVGANRRRSSGRGAAPAAACAGG